MAAKPRVTVIGTGGSISSIGRDSLDLLDYADAGTKLEVDELLARFPVVNAVAELTPVRFRAVGSTRIGPADWLDLARLIHATAATTPTPDGIVVTHGTATTEETAHFLNLVLETEIPVVVVGAQRPASAARSSACSPSTRLGRDRLLRAHGKPGPVGAAPRAPHLTFAAVGRRPPRKQRQPPASPWPGDTRGPLEPASYFSEKCSRSSTPPTTRQFASTRGALPYIVTLR